MVILGNYESTILVEIGDDMIELTRRELGAISPTLQLIYEGMVTRRVLGFDEKINIMARRLKDLSTQSPHQSTYKFIRNA